MFNSIEIIGVIQNIMGGFEVGLGWYIIWRIMTRVFG